MSKITTITCCTKSSSDELNDWLSKFDGGNPGAGMVFDIGERLFVEIGQPDADDDDGKYGVYSWI